MPDGTQDKNPRGGGKSTPQIEKHLLQSGLAYRSAVLEYHYFVFIVLAITYL